MLCNFFKPSSMDDDSVQILGQEISKRYYFGVLFICILKNT